MTIDDKLPDAPWILTGSYMPTDLRTIEVNDGKELIEGIDRLLSLSPSGEVLVSFQPPTE